MTTRRLVLTAAAAAFGLAFGPGGAGANPPRAQADNPLMPNLGVPYTNPALARSLLARNHPGRRRGNPRTGPNRPVIINNYFHGGTGGATPF